MPGGAVEASNESVGPAALVSSPANAAARRRGAVTPGRSLFRASPRPVARTSGSSVRHTQWWKQRQRVYIFHRIIVSIAIGLCVVCVFILSQLSMTIPSNPPSHADQLAAFAGTSATTNDATIPTTANDATISRAIFLAEWNRWTIPLTPPQEADLSHVPFSGPPHDAAHHLESCRWLLRRSESENRRIQALCSSPTSTVVLYNRLTLHERRIQPCFHDDAVMVARHGSSVVLSPHNWSTHCRGTNNMSGAAAFVSLFAVVPTESNAIQGRVPPIALSFTGAKVTGHAPLFPDCNVPCTSYGEPFITCQRSVELITHEAPWTLDFSMEGEQYYPELQVEPLAWQRGHFWSTTSYQSEIPLPYYSKAEYNIQTKHPPVDYTQAIHGAVFLARNCNSKNNREQVVMDLQQSSLRIDSLSLCHHNAEPPPGVDMDNKIEVMRHYLFYLAFENQCTDDYITEKLWGPLEAGTVPIYFGAPNVHDHVPDHAIINIRDFNSTDDLVAYVQLVAANQTLYESYHAWRTQPLPPKFQSKYRLTDTHSTCRTCRWAYARMYGVGWNHSQQELQPLVAGERTVCLHGRGHNAAHRYWMRHPVREVWTTSGRAMSVEPNHNVPVSEPDDNTDACWHLTHANRAVVMDGHVRRTVRYQDGVVDMLMERVAPATGAMVLQLHTPVQSSLLEPLREGAWRLQDGRMRYTLLSLPVASAKAVATDMGVIQVAIAMLPLRLRIIVEDVDTFHQDADKEENFFGKLLTADFYSPLELFVQAG